MLTRVLFVVAIGLAVVLVRPAQAIEASGKAVAVEQDASASGPGGARTLVIDGPVFGGDAIKTNSVGHAQILFADNTKMVVGPNSQVKIDSFVFQGKSTASQFSIGALRGTFRFITGASAKNAYSITTPTATIGVRGTAFDGHIAQDGTTTIALWHGIVRLCDLAVPRRHCTDVSGTCTVIQLDPQHRFKRVNNVYERTNLLERTFPFAFRQGWLRTGFRVQSRGCSIHNFDPPANPAGPQRPDPGSVPEQSADHAANEQLAAPWAARRLRW